MGKVAHAQPPAAPAVRRLSYRIDEAVAATGLSRPTIYRLIERGELSIFKVGTRTLIMASVLEAYLARRAQPQPAA